ncbi:MAG: glycosyltransferase [Oligoflexales bacterium]
MYYTSDITDMSTKRLTKEKPNRLSILKDAHDIICFSHIRWNSSYQRPQQLLSRAASGHRVFFVEEPKCTDARVAPYLEMSHPVSGVTVVVPVLPELDAIVAARAQAQLIDELVADKGINSFVLWYYTPMALTFTSHLHPALVVYDCIDELGALKGSPAELPLLERDLLLRADIVFAGGPSLFESKSSQHNNVYLSPSGVDVQHFAKARSLDFKEPDDQASIVGPRLGFFGVIDERFDSRLVRGIAKARRDWQVVLIGPIERVDPMTLPKLPNIHYLGSKKYEELPSYIAGWEIAILPFVRNESTRFVSPIKIPEYLAAGRRVISTSVPDVVNSYGRKQLVNIADTSERFIAISEKILFGKHDDGMWLANVDDHLKEMSWDRVWQRMWDLIVDSLNDPNRYLKPFTHESIRTPLAL